MKLYFDLHKSTNIYWKKNFRENLVNSLEFFFWIAKFDLKCLNVVQNLRR